MSAAIKASLEQARDNYAAQLEQISKAPKPTYSVEGRSYSWTEYQQFLIEKLRELKKDIDDEQDGDDIVEEVSRVF